MVLNSILELIEENWVQSLWEEVCKAHEIEENKGKAAIIEVDLIRNKHM